MKDEYYELLSSVADDYGLELVETTEDINGYPRHTSYALVGFTDMKQYETVERDINERLVDDDEECVSIDKGYYHKRDGWHFWECLSCGFVEPYDMEEFYDSKDCHQAYIPQTEEEYIRINIATCIDQFSDADELQAFVDMECAICKEVARLKPGQIWVRNMYSDEVAGVVMEKFVMGYYYDTHHYAIGLTIITH